MEAVIEGGQASTGESETHTDTASPTEEVFAVTLPRSCHFEPKVMLAKKPELLKF